jgi:hypothetical protein
MYSVPCAILVIPASAALCCGQQWSAVVLHPPGGWLSEAYAVTATRQGGVFVPPEPGEAQAGMWQGSPASWVPLSPPQWSAEVRGMDEWSQVGNLFGAVLWRGTPESRVDLQPAGATNSGAGAVRGNMQVGAVRVQPDIWHAALWHGSPESFVDLHPPGARSSTAGATDGVLQGGSSHWQVGSLNWARATIWNGTAESFVVLGPADFASVVNGMAPGVQVGHVLFPGQGYRAFVWHGTAESAMNMHPPGQGGGTRFFATSGRVHVGTMTQGGASRAAVNFGAPDAWLGLHQFLPASFAGFSGPTPSTSRGTLCSSPAMRKMASPGSRPSSGSAKSRPSSVTPTVINPSARRSSTLRTSPVSSISSQPDICSPTTSSLVITQTAIDRPRLRR